MATHGMPRAPIVAISATLRPIEGVDRVRLNAAYIRAVEMAGLVPVIVPPLEDPAAVARLLETVDGLVLSGGEDIDPAMYGESRHAALGPVNAARDVTEIALLRAARERALPTLAICRGIQVVNVALGGTLVQDLPSQRPDTRPHDLDDTRAARVHEVRVQADSLLARALGTDRLRVNSIHHQAIDRPGSALRITARSDDGVIEGVESSDATWWLLGVQWHPEELVGTPEPWDRQLFATFAAACRARVSSRSSDAPSGPAASASPANGGAETAARH